MPTFRSAIPFGDKFATEYDTRAGFMPLFVERATSDRPRTGEDLVSEIKEDMTPINLVDPDISEKLPIYGKIWASLEKFDVQVPIAEEAGIKIKYFSHLERAIIWRGSHQCGPSCRWIS